MWSYCSTDGWAIFDGADCIVSRLPETDTVAVSDRPHRRFTRYLIHAIACELETRGVSTVRLVPPSASSAATPNALARAWRMLNEPPPPEVRRRVQSKERKTTDWADVRGRKLGDGANFQTARTPKRREGRELSSRVPRIGPYSQAIRVGNVVYTAGQPGIDPASGVVAGDTFEAQARQAFANLAAVLEDSGSRLQRVVRVTCFVADRMAFPTLNALFAEYFPDAPPVRSTPIVELPRGLLFSIDAIAVVDDSAP